MSYTLTNSAETSTILRLSPSRNRRTVEPPSIKEIWAWTLTSDSIASCSIRDVHQLRENEEFHYDFFWLGRVPCRSVKLVGMVVGVIVYEKRIIYTVDDGTAVIDCNHPQPSTQPKVNTSDLSAKREPPPVLKPVAKVGNFTRVVGRIRAVHGLRQIIVDRIEICSSPNDELVHTRTVRQLHRTSYSLCEPFFIPPRISQPAFATPTKNRVMAMQTPSTTRSSPPSSISSSPVKPEPSEHIHKSPRKLRHPSRLHSQDINSNTFQIYVKHYMDHVPIISNISESELEYACDDPFATSMADMPARPTELSRYNYTDETPRPKRPRHQLESTPRPRILQPNFTSFVASSSHAQHSSSTPDTGRQGISLSYLRRVPELSLLASRVVQAVTRRRLREERKKLKEAGKFKSKTQTSSAIPPDEIRLKMKRLFQWAIIQLLEEGCIVLWDGPVRKSSNASTANTSRLWKSATNSNATLDGPTTSFGSTMTSNRSNSLYNNTHDINDCDEADLSDPSPDEETYISLTPEFSADSIEATIKLLSDRQEKMEKPYAGVTVQEILAFMRKDDDMWRYLGDWTVKDALDLLNKEGRVWRTGKDSWDVTV